MLKYKNIYIVTLITDRYPKFSTEKEYLLNLYHVRPIARPVYKFTLQRYSLLDFWECASLSDKIKYLVY